MDTCEKQVIRMQVISYREAGNRKAGGKAVKS